IANNLAWLLATCPEATIRDGHRAIELAHQAEKLSRGNDPVCIATLAAGYAEAGNFPEAIATAQRAFDLACQQFNTALANAVSRQMEIYRSGMPLREASGALPSSEQP